MLFTDLLSISAGGFSFKPIQFRRRQNLNFVGAPVLLVSLRDKHERPILSRTRLHAEQVLDKAKCTSLGFRIIVLYHAVKLSQLL